MFEASQVFTTGCAALRDRSSMKPPAKSTCSRLADLATSAHLAVEQ
jgi:hypothetical protein